MPDPRASHNAPLYGTVAVLNIQLMPSDDSPTITVPLAPSRSQLGSVKAMLPFWNVKPGGTARCR